MAGIAAAAVLAVPGGMAISNAFVDRHTLPDWLFLDDDFDEVQTSWPCWSRPS